MSLINQVLNDLEQRGTGVARKDAVRPVPVPGKGVLRHPFVWGAATAILVVVAGMAWWKMQRHVLVPPPTQRLHVAKLKTATLKPASQPASAEAIVAEPENMPAEPTLSLSFELSSIPLPSTAVRQPAPKPPRVVQKQRPRSIAEKPKVQSAKTESQAGYGGPPIKHISPKQQARDEYSQALALIQQGRKSEAVPHLETTLQLDPDQVAARRTLAGLLLEARRNADAEQVLQQGLRHDPRQSDLAMLLARLQVERGALQQALQTLNTTMPFADQRADYHAFIAAVLQRLNRNKEAITHYQIALHLAPGSAVWWMGLGISFQAVDDDEDARDSFSMLPTCTS